MPGTKANTCRLVAGEGKKEERKKGRKVREKERGGHRRAK